MHRLSIECRKVMLAGRARGLAHRFASTAGAAAPAASSQLLDKVLIANRGEIACRIMRTARRLGMKTVAVYSDADAKSQHVAMADEAYHIGPSAASASYLRADVLLETALRCGAKAIHPGYGFLSENEAFSRMCAENSVKFVGPPHTAIRDMGSKAASKVIMTKAGVPVTPGYWGDDQSPRTMSTQADTIGYPVMLKAVKGGGGKGMRIVHKADEMKDSLEACQREAKNSFGDSRVLVEKYLARPRHVELQVFADSHGNAVYLYERDCSVQRRHQKVLEEAPAPGLPENIRHAMGKSAVAAALAVGYEGAGTVEFMLDVDGKYYFMEMNTRLQVEHPVTELITGLDLVEWQLRIASGQPIPLTQEQVRVQGHALEARVYAESPRNNFLPATGVLKHLKSPVQTTNVRVDTGVRQGDSVSIFYDPMISKLIVWGENRSDAIRHMTAALREYQVVGLPNNIDFLLRTVNHPGFVAGGVDTSFLGKHLQECLPEANPAPDSVFMIAAAATVLRASSAPSPSDYGTAVAADDPASPWNIVTGARPATPGFATMVFNFSDPERPAPPPPTEGAKKHPKEHIPAHGHVEIVHEGRADGAAAGRAPGTGFRSGTFSVKVGAKGERARVTASYQPITSQIAEQSTIKTFENATRGRTVPGLTAAAVTVTVGTTTLKATVVHSDDKDGTEIAVFPEVPLAAAGAKHATVLPHSYRVILPTPKFGKAGERSGGRAVVTPMPGKVVKVLVTKGQAVTPGTPLMILEAMKMEHVIKAHVAATVAELKFKEGDFVEDGKELVTFVAK